MAKLKTSVKVSIYNMVAMLEGHILWQRIAHAVARAMGTSNGRAQSVISVMRKLWMEMFSTMQSLKEADILRIRSR